MKIIKKHLLVAVSALLIGISCDIHAMGGPQIQTYDTILKNMFQRAITGVQNFFSYIASSLGTAVKTSSPSPVTISKPQGIPTWVTLTGAILTATTREFKAGALKKLLAYIHNPSSTETSPQFQKFSELPLELKTKIIAFATLNSSAKTLSKATQAIKALSKVNKQFNTILNKLINDPKFCLKIIKSLGQQFNVSDEEAAKALHTKTAKNRLELQDRLKLLCENFDNIEPEIIDLKNRGADLNFSYGEGSLPAKTPLMLALLNRHYVTAQVLLDNGSDINQIIVAPIYSNKNTALTYFTYTINRLAHHNLNKDFATSTFLLNQKNIIVDQKVPPHDDTALIILVKEMNNYTINPTIFKMLLDAGANPTIINTAGESAESSISNSFLSNKQELLDLIEDAKRNKKWEKSPQ